jgi:hypothetical protein
LLGDEMIVIARTGCDAGSFCSHKLPKCRA